MESDSFSREFGHVVVRDEEWLMRVWNMLIDEASRKVLRTSCDDSRNEDVSTRDYRKFLSQQVHSHIVVITHLL